MINLYSILDGGDFIVDLRYFEDGTQPLNSTIKKPVNNELKPKYDVLSDSIIEGATAQEINDINSPIYEAEIVAIYSMLCERALRSSMSKGYEYDTYQKLKQQQEEFFDMYSVATGQSTKQTVIDEIQDEIDMDFPLVVLEAELISYGITPTGTHLEKMFQLIIFKYEYGAGIYDEYMHYARTFRKKSRSWSASNLWSKLDSGFELARNAPEQLTVAEAGDLFTEFNAL